VTTHTNNGEPTPLARPTGPADHICWSSFVELPGITEAIARDVYDANAYNTDYRRKTIAFLRRHGFRWVDGP
jgi:hypothetical protein